MNKYFAMAMAGASLCCIAGTANAAVTLTTTSINSVYNGAPTADLNKTSDPTKTVNNVTVTPQTLKGTLKTSAADPGLPVEYFAYCIDIFQGAGNTTFNVVSLLDYLGGNTTKANQIASLISAQGAKVDKLHDAAVQLAIWEIVNETMSTLDIDKIVKLGDWKWSYSKGWYQEDISDPQFWADDVNNGAGVLAAADTYLNAAKNGANITSGLNLYVAKSDSKQDFLFWSYTPAVPEPATWAMMLLGFGTVGYAMRSKRRNSAVSFS